MIRNKTQIFTCNRKTKSEHLFGLYNTYNVSIPVCKLGSSQNKMKGILVTIPIVDKIQLFQTKISIKANLEQNCAGTVLR